MKKKILLFSSILLLGACATSSNVATSNVGNITKDEFYTAMKQTQGATTLFTLLASKIAEANIKDKDAVNKEVDAYISSNVTSSGGEEAFLKILKERGYTSKEDFRKVVYSNYAITQYIKEQTTISDEEIATAYETYEMKVTASHILVADENKAKEIIESLNNGADWNTLAKENSTDTSNKDNGGSLGEFKPSSMVAEFATALKTMKDNEISSEPVKTSFGYHIIKMEKNPEKGSLEELKETISSELIDTKLQDATYKQEVMQKAIQNAKVDISDEFLKNALNPILTPSENK